MAAERRVAGGGSQGVQLSAVPGAGAQGGPQLGQRALSPARFLSLVPIECRVCLQADGQTALHLVPGSIGAAELVRLGCDVSIPDNVSRPCMLLVLDWCVMLGVLVCCRL